MIFPKNDYITFNVSKESLVSFTFSDKKPKKLWFNAGADNVSFRLKINDDDVGMLIDMSKNYQKEILIPTTVNKIIISTSVANSFQLTILVEEWGN